MPETASSEDGEALEVVGVGVAVKRSVKSAVLCLLAVGLAFVPLRGQFTELDQLNFEQIVGGLELPVAITHAGDGSGRLFLTLQRGRVVIFAGTGLLEDSFLDIRGRVQCCGERGLLSIAFHPEFTENGFFYVNYTDPRGDTVVSRFRVSDDPNVTDPNSETILLTIGQPFGNHNGGQLQFGPDGFLYIGMGDGGSGGDPGNRAQDLTTLLGKMLRLDVDGGPPFAIPPTNPFVNTLGARPEIWALGLRNPWRFSFDRQTGDLFIGDVGQNSIEEIDFQPARSDGGENYGWRRMEGNTCFNPTVGCNDGSLVLPILEYRHVSSGCSGSVTGGYRYRGSQFPQLNGVYFYADFCTTRLYAATEEGGAWTAMPPRQTGFGISAFGENEAGELYFADRTAGVLYRIKIDHPVPLLSSLSPGMAVAGGPPFVLVVTGSNFVPGSEVRWNGSARPTVFRDNARLEATIAAADIAAMGEAQISVFNPLPGGGLTAPRVFRITAPLISPMLNEGGVVEAAGYNGILGVSPGSVTAVFGTDLAASTETALTDPLPTTLGGATLRFSGAAAAPIFFTSPTQINIQIPWELAGAEEVQLTSAVGEQVSPAVTVPLMSYSPGIFTLDGSGTGQGAIIITGTEGTVAAPVGSFGDARPARLGETLAIFAGGLGPVTNPPPTGSATPLEPPSQTTSLPVVTIGGAEAAVSFSGLGPALVGLYQVNVEVPPGLPSGNAVAVVLRIAGKMSNTVTIAVE